MATKSREYFLSKVQKGSCIVFIDSKGMKIGNVHDILPDGTWVVRTKNFSIYYVKPEQFVWLKTGTRLPEGILNAIRYRER